MANSVNQVIEIGNLTRDVDLRFTPKGTAVAQIGIAVNEAYTTSDGEKREKTIFLDVKVWGKLAELCAEYLKKGSSALFIGRLDQEVWDDKQTGQKRSKIIIVADQVRFLGGKQNSERPRTEDRKSQGRQKPPHDPDLDVEDQDVPF
jgi:single-strand DNA-binding protein